MKKIIVFGLLLLILFNPISVLSFDKRGYEHIKVVLDDNYPPYTFRDKNQQLQGILIDRWKLWEKTTGIQVTIIGKDWIEAQEFINKGNADVIDTIFKNPEREKIYSFSKPYANIDVPIFVHENIEGVSDIDNLHGFTIGVKDGDAVIEVLRAKGINSLERYSNYEALINAVKQKKIWVFTVDKPPAHYFLHKLGIAGEIRETGILYTGKFHMAVLKGNENLLGVVEDGFSQIYSNELVRIDEKWIGKPIVSKINYRYFIYSVIALIIITGVLFAWNYLLRKVVERKTHQLTSTLESLKSSQRNLILMNFAVDSSYDMVFRIIRDGTIQYVNTTTCNKLKYQYDEIIGMNISLLITKQQKFLDILERIEIVKKVNIETEFIDKEGNVFPSHLTLSSFEFDGDSYFYVFAKDISDLKALEKEMIKKEKIESLGLLAGGIAHDFNNLLMIIVGNLSLLRLNFSDNNELLNLLSKAEKSTQKAKELTDKLLIFAKGGVPIKKTTSLKHIVNETLSFAMSGSKITCDVVIDEDIKNVDVDVTQIHQVLHNLIVNAIQSMPDSGKITIKVTNYHIDETSRLPLSLGEYVQIKISDTGKGIKPEDLSKIFDPYFTTKPNGSGLGLATVYSIIRKHDGYISVESKLNKGTTFYIYLPVSQNQAITL